LRDGGLVFAILINLKIKSRIPSARDANIRARRLPERGPGGSGEVEGEAGFA